MGEGQAPKTTGGVHENAHGGIPEELIRAELNQVLQSQGFRSSKRSQDFLRYVVERTLEGQADTLKERTIGIDVFGRSSAYDPSDDATVRVKAGEVRKRLGLFTRARGARMKCGSNCHTGRTCRSSTAWKFPLSRPETSPPAPQPSRYPGGVGRFRWE